MSICPRVNIDVDIVDMLALGVPICKNIEWYVTTQTGCFCDINEERDLKEDIKAASHTIFKGCPPDVLIQRAGRGDPEACLEVALRHVLVFCPFHETATRRQSLGFSLDAQSKRSASGRSSSQWIDSPPPMR